MKKKTLFFNGSVDGHYMEYIHHIYMNCVHIKEEDFVFMFPPTFKLVSDKLKWPTFSNVSIDLISEVEYEKFKLNGILKPYYHCFSLKRAVKKHKVSNVFLIALMGYLPFLPFFLNKKIRVSGIVYLIYLYRWKNSNIKSRISDAIKYVLFSKSSIFDKIYLLNDKIAPIYLNKKFNTKVFNYLPDPFMPVSNIELKSVRSELNISNDKYICLHFGVLTERKGTIEILAAILEAKNEEISKCCFIFAGKVLDDIKELFYSMVAEAEKKTQIIVFDQFCEYNLLNTLCYSSNFILVPYKITEQSSGLIGYAAHFKVPVISPIDGLLGKLVRRHKLGFRIKNINSTGMISFFNNIEDYKMKIDSNYLLDKSVSDFNHVIFQ